jgi:hypothetical protein
MPDRRKSKKAAWDEFWKSIKREKITFLDVKGRNRRVCTTEEPTNFFLRGLIKLANDHQSQKSTITLCMDVENDLVHHNTKMRRPTDQHYWSRERLTNHRVTSDQIAARETYQREVIRKKWKKLSPQKKDRQYWGFN